jgi:drug/metabolite transporter (DMT)-like permease
VTPSKARASAVPLALFVVFLWATSWVFVKIGLASLPPLTFAGLRYGVASLVLVPAALLRGGASELRSMTRRDGGRLVALGVLLYAVTQGAIFLALDHLPAVTVNLLWSFSTIAVALIAGIWLSETPTQGQWVGIFTATAGALVYFLPADFGSSGRIGLLAAVVGVLSNAGAVVLGREVNRAALASPAVVTAVSMSVGAAILLSAGVILERPPELDGRAWAIVLWLAIVNTAVAFTLWNRTQRVLTAVESSIINSTMLIWIPILAVAFLGETLTAKEVTGMGLVAAGAVLVQRRARPPKANRPA